jgi:ATP-binding cassette subfamily B protein
MQTEPHTPFSEKTIEKAREIHLLKQLYPFIRPYRAMLGITLFLMLAITAFDLAIPYITKVAIDQYIVPGYQQDSAAGEHADTGEKEGQESRHLLVDGSDPQINAVISAHPNMFEPAEGAAVENENMAKISYRDLKRLSPREARTLRHEDIAGLGRVAAVLVVVILLNFFANFFQVFLMELIGQRIMHGLRIRLFTHIQSLSVRFFTRNPLGRLVTRVTNDIQNMHEMFTSVIIFVMKDIFLIAGITIVLFAIDWQLSLVVYAIFPFVFFAAAKFAGAARGAFRTLRIKTAEINSRFSETIGGMSVIQLFQQEKENYRSFERLNHEYFAAGMQQITVFALFMPFIELMSSVVLAVVIFYGGGSLLAERITLGTLVVFISYLRMFFRPIRDIAEKYNITLNAMSSAERIFLVMSETDREPEPDPKERTPVPDAIHSLAFDRVSFSYNPDEPVLKDVSLEIAGGETLAVVGPTGAGKTSLINLIARFYDPDAGSIKINGIDIKRLPLPELRAKIALVMQDPFLFSTTIRENIFPGRAETVDTAEIDRILDDANCRRFIERLPEGLDTELSEGASSLSSGQRQLIAIARALAHRPELIILDEATSYIDSETEQEIQNALKRLMESRTSIVIAHRLSTARVADRIVVVKRGRIIESGSHEHLMRSKGFYHRLYMLQG